MIAGAVRRTVSKPDACGCLAEDGVSVGTNDLDIAAGETILMRSESSGHTRTQGWELSDGSPGVRHTVIRGENAMQKMLLITTLVLAIGMTGCQTKTGTYGAVGAATGAVIGGVIGHQSGKTAEGAAIGAALGGAGGAATGHHQDKKDKTE
jgi:hypothetical protein